MGLYEKLILPRPLDAAMREAVDLHVSGLGDELIESGSGILRQRQRWFRAWATASGGFPQEAPKCDFQPAGTAELGSALSVRPDCRSRDIQSGGDLARLLREVAGVRPELFESA